jgi:hypothetical protein
VPGSTTASDVLLDQMVRYASAQSDSADKFSTRAGAVLSLGGAAFAAGVTVISAPSRVSVTALVIGTGFLAISILLSGWAFKSSNWTLTPALDDAKIKAALAASAESVRKGLVLGYVEACRRNEDLLERVAQRVNAALVLIVLGIALLALSYVAGKLGI